MGDHGWTPVLSPDGKIYCSPRCGFRCLKSDYDDAVAAAASLAERMGAGWEPRIWENGGWHYSVMNGVAYLSPNIDRSRGRPWKLRGYQVFFNSAHQFVCDATEPEDAWGIATQEARTHIIRIEGDLRHIIDGGRHD